MAKKKVLVLASNLGLWAEELQGPWDALTGAGHEIQLATDRGITVCGTGAVGTPTWAA